MIKPIVLVNNCLFDDFPRKFNFPDFKHQLHDDDIIHDDDIMSSSCSSKLDFRSLYYSCTWVA